MKKLKNTKTWPEKSKVVGAEDKGDTSGIGNTGNHSTKAEGESWSHGVQHHLNSSKDRPRDD